MVRGYKQDAYNQSLRNAKMGVIHPVLACVRLTRKCNLKCDYCSEILVSSGEDLGFSSWKNVVDIAYKLGNRDIVLSGGEPLLKLYLPDLVRYSSSRDAFTSVATNGHILNKKYLSKLDIAGLDYLCISIDTLDKTAKWGKAITNDLGNILECISTSNYNFETQISTVVTKKNLKELPEMVEYFSSLNIPTKFMIMMRNKINEESTKDLCLNENKDEIEKTVKKLLKMKKSGALLIDGDFTLNRLSQYFGDEFNYNCNGGIYDFSVNNDGRLVICPDGIISEKSVFELNTLKDYRKFIDESKKVTDKCQGCLWSFKQRLEESIKG